MTEPTRDKKHDRIAHKIERHLDDAKEAWLDLDWEGVHVVVESVDSGTRDEYVIRDHRLEWIMPVYAQPISERAGGFDLWSQDGVSGVTLSLSSNQISSLETLKTFFHESFHSFEQADWIYLASGSRDSIYPIQIEPLYYRGMIFLAFEAYLKNPSLVHLQEAKFWQNRLKKEFPQQELNWRVYDQVEGSAFYFENQLFPQHRREKIKSDKDLARTLVNDTDQFHYILGDLAGQILETIKPDWQTQVEAGADPISLLLDDVEPQQNVLLRIDLEVVDPINFIMNGVEVFPNHQSAVERERLKQNLEDEAAVANREFANIFEPFWQQQNNPDFIEIRVPYDLQHGSFSTSGFWTLEHPGRTSVSVLTEFRTQFFNSEQNSLFYFDSGKTVVEWTTGIYRFYVSKEDPMLKNLDFLAFEKTVETKPSGQELWNLVVKN